MASRETRAAIARETVDILNRGWYANPGGEKVPLADDLASAKSRSVLHAPDDFVEIFRQCDQFLQERAGRPACRFEVANETTLHAARRLVEADGRSHVLALNFASARHPGGRFLNGSQAQEESLARASGLYACLSQHPQMYDANRRFPSCLYTDHMIWSPDVPAFRGDDDGLLDRPFPVSFLTAPAVNAGAVRKNEPANVARIEPVMRERIEKVLAVALVHGHEALVLGAWGCGVFGNHPASVAREFAHYLTGGGRFRTAFERVVFAVLDRGPDRSTIRPFEEVFGRSA